MHDAAQQEIGCGGWRQKAKFKLDMENNQHGHMISRKNGGTCRKCVNFHKFILNYDIVVFDSMPFKYSM